MPPESLLTLRWARSGLCLPGLRLLATLPPVSPLLLFPDSDALTPVGGSLPPVLLPSPPVELKLKLLLLSPALAAEEEEAGVVRSRHAAVPGPTSISLFAPPGGSC